MTGPARTVATLLPRAAYDHRSPGDVGFRQEYEHGLTSVIVRICCNTRYEWKVCIKIPRFSDILAFPVPIHVSRTQKNLDTMETMHRGGDENSGAKRTSGVSVNALLVYSGLYFQIALRER